MTDAETMLLLARWQFGFTIGFHIIFPALSIGLASYLAVVEGLWLKTGRRVYLNLYRYWVKIFALSFGMGVVSGIVMSYQFGTNWSRFSEATGSVLGPLLGYEVLTAFFLEASFLAIMLFGWDRVGRGLHFASTCIVAIGTLISAFWILAANSWMQTPAGYELTDGIFTATSWLEVIFNPSFPYRLAHMVMAAYLATALVVVGAASWQLLRGRVNEETRVMMRMGIPFLAIVSVLQLIAGHAHGENVLEYQPAKLAAMEGHWEPQRRAPVILFAIPDEEAETNRHVIAIPEIGSLVVAGDMDAELPGLRQWQREDRPPMTPVFFGFRVMVGLGVLMILLGLAGSVLLLRGTLERSRLFQRACVAMTPAGFIAILAGWITAEVGRQPWTVYGLMRTAESTSPVTADGVGMSLTVYVFTYLIVFAAGAYYMLRIAAQGPDTGEPEPTTPALAAWVDLHPGAPREGIR